MQHVWSRSRTLGEITRGEHDGRLQSVLTTGNSKSVDDLRRRQWRPLPQRRAKFPSVTDLIAFYDSCDGGSDGEDDISPRRAKSSSVSELHILGGTSKEACNYISRAKIIVRIYNSFASS